jgi:hypothetical protein
MLVLTEDGNGVDAGGDQVMSDQVDIRVPRTRVVINFPYSGYQEGTPREEVFWRIVEACHRTAAQYIIVVMDQDTMARAKAFLDDARVKQYDLRVHRTWSVDTCDRWLAGWAVALGLLPCTGVRDDQTRTLDKPHDDDRIILLPGDIEAVARPVQFFNASLPAFLDQGGVRDIVVGDFEAGEKLASKDLVDLYGTYPLLALWFPEIAAEVRDLSIWKPRSEWVSVRARVLRSLLSNRRFAYEQTLNMLIRSWEVSKRGHAESDETNSQAGAAAGRAEDSAAAGDSKRPRRIYEVADFSLGEFADDSSERNIPGAIDQIERTERMLKMIWREIKFGEVAADAKEGAEKVSSDPQSAEYKKEYRRIYLKEAAKILEDYDRLEATSRAIEAAARVTVLSLITR